MSHAKGQTEKKQNGSLAEESTALTSAVAVIHRDIAWVDQKRDC